ncbi:hypothetical protein LR48_Vigan09g004100 [Vigna angularis]|uniref:CBF1-interacting co-repressor CIR N-terminal domain-containing protein n=1 Tax=Phaseolus angularis TaxID=3914 RepID=A0A0L9V906_PHAAN|nr:hypothetical protein LR48_Vigan09g004100 [Vigna angularis]
MVKHRQCSRERSEKESRIYVMEGEEGGGIRLSKRIANGEVDYKTKSGTAWSYSYLNQKPWHPLSYPNQRRKWIAEQTHANRQRRAEEVSREEQEFVRQIALISKKEKEKHHYFKVIIDAAGRHEFHDGEGNPLFPFYWTREPRKIKAFPVRVLSPADLEVVRTINALPHRISARHLVECLSLEDCGQKAFELMTTPAPRQSNYMASRKRGGASSSSTRPKVAPNAPHPPPSRRSSLGGHLPPVRITQVQQTPQVENAGGSIPGGRASGPDPLSGLATVHVDPSSEAATVSVAPLVRKRKDPTVEGRKDKECSSSRSASKKARKGKEKEKDKERVPSMPLPGGIFSPAFSMSDRTKFQMSSSQRALIEPLSELELTNAMLEMSTRAASLAWYLKEFADRPGVEDVRAELLAEKKNSTLIISIGSSMLIFLVVTIGFLKSHGPTVGAKCFGCEGLCSSNVSTSSPARASYFSSSVLTPQFLPQSAGGRPAKDSPMSKSVESNGVFLLNSNKCAVNATYLPLTLDLYL